MSQTLLKSLQCKGTTVFVANGVAAGQKAPHVLIHVFPRRENDDLVKLPNYEMSDEQIEKLKLELKPYMNQVFGIRKKIVKEAEFTEKKEEKIEHKEKHPEVEQIEEEQSDEEKQEEVLIEKIKSEHLNKKSAPEKKSAAKKNSTKTDSKKVDLDDIARLFGG
jgi:diadenosine tetraphosphate (Ap4A) HIT family hydrolase